MVLIGKFKMYGIFLAHLHNYIELKSLVFSNLNQLLKMYRGKPLSDLETKQQKNASRISHSYNITIFLSNEETKNEKY